MHSSFCHCYQRLLSKEVFEYTQMLLRTAQILSCRVQRHQNRIENPVHINPLKLSAGSAVTNTIMTSSLFKLLMHFKNYCIYAHSMEISFSPTVCWLQRQFYPIVTFFLFIFSFRLLKTLKYYKKQYYW